MPKYALLCLILSCCFAPLFTSAQDKKPATEPKIIFVPPAKTPKLNRQRLLPDAPRKGGKFVENDKTVAEMLGDVASVEVHYFSPNWKRFDDAKAFVLKLLNGKPHEGYFAYEPWAEGTQPAIIATVRFKNKTSAPFEASRVGHVGFQDATSKYWWARLPDPIFAPLK